MKYKVGDLLITKVDDIDITLKDNRYEFSKKNKFFLIVDCYNNEEYELISQETRGISEWTKGSIEQCFDKV